MGEVGDRLVRTLTKIGHELLSLQKPPSGRPLHVTSNFPLVRIVPV
jgi:hypothetical protein